MMNRIKRLSALITVLLAVVLLALTVVSVTAGTTDSHWRNSIDSSSGDMYPPPEELPTPTVIGFDPDAVGPHDPTETPAPGSADGGETDEGMRDGLLPLDWQTWLIVWGCSSVFCGGIVIALGALFFFRRPSSGKGETAE